MNEQHKQTLLDAAREHIATIRNKILESVKNREIKTTTMSKDAIKMQPGDAIAQRTLVAHNQEQIENLKQLYPSPYFTRCDFVINGEKRTMYFAKFSMSEEGIYSWITPAATLRFEDPGIAAYTRPDGSIQSGTIERKDQYMIVDGKLLFFSTENADVPRELIFQEHFTKQKSGFILPEVVEQMEKAQDQVIRAHHEGPFVISGPAGSGKTTLALHRVAYLMQSPETAEWYRAENILVLVQDNGTKAYFSQLLPDLGIKGVPIMTFADWALAVLNLADATYITDYGDFEDIRLSFEFSKLHILRQGNFPAYTKNVYSYLQSLYKNNLNSDEQKIFVWQKKNKLLDRIDLTILLTAYYQKHKEFGIEKEYYETLSNGSYRKRVGSFPALYNLMVVDEFQNYLPEQIALLNSSINKRVRSTIYVGDVAQQTQLGTIRDWSHIKLEASGDRLVRLQKVYRNTHEILSYIRSIGYAVEIPEQIKHGDPVVETRCASQDEVLHYIESEITKAPNSMYGVLARDKRELAPLKQRFINQPNVHCLSFYEAQGVEFDTVFLLQNKATVLSGGVPDSLIEEVARIEKDLLYVALTRAMSRLNILSS